jgi:hypothetical protein
VEEAQAGRLMKDFARRVNQIARAAGSRKVLIGHVWDAMDFPHRQAFEKDLLRAHRDGEVELQRADLPLEADDYESSHVVSPIGAEFDYVIAPRTNPSPPLDEARKMFLKFHRLEPSAVEVDEEARMPTHAVCLGKAVHVLYRSGKVDPETGKKPRTPVNYIHEHDAGVHLYEVDSEFAGEEVEVPSEVREETDVGDTMLVLLGDCLGLAFKSEDDGEEYEFDLGKGVELYCVPSGKALVVVQDKREILYLVWGGALGVEPRGIVG